MTKRRVVEVEVESESSALWWTLGGVAAGAVLGIVLAERSSGGRLDVRGLTRQVRRVARLFGAQWEPLLGVAMELYDGFVAARAGKVDESGFRAADFELEEEFEDDEGNDFVNGEDAEDQEGSDSDDSEDNAGSVIGERVLTAFVNDPVLAERSVEIEADDRGFVVLHGSVRTAKEVAHAVTLAGGVPGVIGVRQRLGVKLRR